MKWTEGHIHLAMRQILKNQGWLLIAGEFPGGSDHELYPLNIVDPTIAKDCSPDPRRHSLGELIPDLVALRKRDLIIGEAKIKYNHIDQEKLEYLLSERRDHLLIALRKFAQDHHFPELIPVETLELRPVLIFAAHSPTPPKPEGIFSYLRISSMREGFFQGVLCEVYS